MLKKYGKKGFTLVEMLVVIAIIALLVSIIVPTVSKTTTKSAAAANAANLRSVEGELSALRFTNPDALENYVFQDVSSYIGAWVGTIQGVMQTAPNLGVFLALSNALANIEDLLVENVFYGQDGKILLRGIVIEAPAAKALSVDGINISKNTQMEVIISDTGIIATYGGMTAAVFAAIAEDGDVGDYSNVAHTYVDSNRDNVCDICNGAYPHTNQEIADGIIGGVISGAHVCTNNDGDCKCDDPNCNVKQCVDRDGNGHCDRCGDVAPGGSHSDPDNTGSCSICGTTGSFHSCSDSSSDRDHICDGANCNETKGSCDHSTSVINWFGTCNCGYTERNCPNC